MIDLAESEEELWKNLDAKSCRYEIRKIKKLLDAGENIEITKNDNVQSFLDIANRYNKTRNYSTRLKKFDLSRYMDVDKGELLTISYNGKIIGGNFYLKDHTHRVRLLFSYNDRLGNKDIAKISGPMIRYLHWTASSALH